MSFFGILILGIQIITKGEKNNCEISTLERNGSQTWWQTPLISALENKGKRIMSSRIVSAT